MKYTIPPCILVAISMLFTISLISTAALANAQASPSSLLQNTPADMLSVDALSKLRQIKNQVENRGGTLSLNTVELSYSASHDQHMETMGGKDGVASCTVSVTINIAGQQATMTATAATCAAAMAMIAEGIASIG